MILRFCWFALLTALLLSVVKSQLLAQTVVQSADGDALKTAQTPCALIEQSLPDAQSWYISFETNNQTDKLQETLQDYARCVQENPQHVVMRVRLARLLLAGDDTAGATREAQFARELDPLNPEAAYVLGLIDLKLGSNVRAYQQTQKTIEFNSDFAPAHKLRFDLLMKQLDGVPVIDLPRLELFREAAETLEKLIQLLPDALDVEAKREQVKTLRLYLKTIDEKQSADAQSDNLSSTTTALSKTRFKIISKPQPGYTEEARRANVSGTIILEVELLENATIGKVLVLKGLSHGLTEKAVEMARGIKFEPATKNGKQISTTFVVEYKFSIY